MGCRKNRYDLVIDVDSVLIRSDEIVIENHRRRPYSNNDVAGVSDYHQNNDVGGVSRRKRCWNDNDVAGDFRRRKCCRHY